MAERKTGAAYDLSLFEQKKPSVVALEPNKMQQQAILRRKRLQTACKVISGVLAAAFVLSAFVLMIVSRVQLTELNEASAALQEQIAILESENVRLNGELSGLASAQSIEQYAQQHGMQKVQSHQIEYFTMDETDRIETPDTDDGGFWSSLWNTVVGWFS